MVESHWIECLGRSEEIAGDELGALVDELIEGVLPIGAGLSPDNWAGAPGDRFAITINALAVAFHIPLLKVGGKAVQVLVVGEDGVSLGVVEVVVPDAKEGKGHWQILFDGCFQKVFIHFVRTCKKLGKAIISNGKSDTQSDS